MLISIPLKINKIDGMPIERDDSFIVDINQSNDDEIAVHIYNIHLRIKRNDLAEVLGLLNAYYQYE